MTFDRKLKILRGNTAKLAIESCLLAMQDGKVSPRHVRDVLRCEAIPENIFDCFLRHKNDLVRTSAAEIIACKGNGTLVVQAIMDESETSVLVEMLCGLTKAKYRNVEDLTVLLKSDNQMVIEETFKMFVGVGRADLLFGLMIGTDDRTTERVRRYLNEQGWLD